MRCGYLAAAGLAALLAGCVPPPAPGGVAPGELTRVRFEDIPAWRTDNLAQSLPALRAGCRRLETLPADTGLGGTGIAADYAGKAGMWVAACNAAGALTPGDDAGVRQYYETWFTPYRIAAAGLFTGYYEPEVRGSLTQFGAYQTPVLARPADLLQGVTPPADPHASGQPVMGRLVAGRLVPYWSRAEIEAGQIGDAARKLLWLADPVDLFFLQIQGAGRVQLPDNSFVRVGYDGKNGRPYTPIGRVLVQMNALAPGAVTMQSIRAWLAAHPAQAKSVMDRNEDYVFFRVLMDAEPGLGPPGALGVNLVPGRSAAVDRRAIPLGTPIFVDTTEPGTGAPWRHLLLAQDVGSDILGAARADVFWGPGAPPAARAGPRHPGGEGYVLLPKQGS
jgi:membrane-bound lytic murein transglycosylase A